MMFKDIFDPCINRPAETIIPIKKGMAAKLGGHPQDDRFLYPLFFKPGELICEITGGIINFIRQKK